jgi:hypothetical protein
MNKIIAVLKNNLKLIIGGVALAAVAGFSTGQLSKKDVPPAPINPIVEIPEIVVVPKEVKSKGVKVKDVSTPNDIDSRNYAELILAYQGKTLQFGSACQVRVKDQTYKVDSEILIDNRNSFPISIKLGQNVYQLDSYGHKVISLNTKGVFMVDCNDYENVATISVQK